MQISVFHGIYKIHAAESKSQILKIPEKIHVKSPVLLNIKNNSKTEDRNCFYHVNLMKQLRAKWQEYIDNEQRTGREE